MFPAEQSPLTRAPGQEQVSHHNVERTGPVPHHQARILHHQLHPRIPQRPPIEPFEVLRRIHDHQRTQLRHHDPFDSRMQHRPPHGAARGQPKHPHRTRPTVQQDRQMRLPLLVRLRPGASQRVAVVERDPPVVVRASHGSHHSFAPRADSHRLAPRRGRHLRQPARPNRQDADDCQPAPQPPTHPATPTNDHRNQPQRQEAQHPHRQPESEPRQQHQRHQLGTQPSAHTVHGQQPCHGRARSGADRHAAHQRRKHRTQRHATRHHQQRRQTRHAQVIARRRQLVRNRNQPRPQLRQQARLQGHAHRPQPQPPGHLPSRARAFHSPGRSHPGTHHQREQNRPEHRRPGELRVDRHLREVLLKHHLQPEHPGTRRKGQHVPPESPRILSRDSSRSRHRRIHGNPFRSGPEQCRQRHEAIEHTGQQAGRIQAQPGQDPERDPRQAHNAPGRVRHVQHQRRAPCRRNRTDHRRKHHPHREGRRRDHQHRKHPTHHTRTQHRPQPVPQRHRSQHRQHQHGHRHAQPGPVRTDRIPRRPRGPERQPGKENSHHARERPGPRSQDVDHPARPEQLMRKRRGPAAKQQQARNQR